MTGKDSSVMLLSLFMKDELRADGRQAFTICGLRWVKSVVKRSSADLQLLICLDRLVFELPLTLLQFPLHINQLQIQLLSFVLSSCGSSCLLC